jgi:hypothetical protein
MSAKLVTTIRVATVTLVFLLTQAAEAQRLDVVKVATEIAKGVGTVGRKVSTGTTGPVFVFEENHAAKVGQLQIAVMLVRLHDRHGLRTVGLEGALQSPRPLAGQWFHNAGGPSAKWAREDVAVRMLAEGEISSAEFMTLLFSGIQVHGTEVQAQYDVELDVKQSPEITYLLSIAEKLLTQEDIKHVNQLMSQKKEEEAFQYMMTRDPWVRRQYRALERTSSPSIERTLQQIREIQRKAQEVGVQVEPQVQQELENARKFYEAAAKRTDTMVDHVMRLPGATSGKPVAMIVGAAHTNRVLDLLRARGAAFAQITPLVGLNPKSAMLSDEQFARKNARKWVRTSPGTLGRLLNANRKPPPIIETATAQSYASMNLAAELVAEAARAGTPIPEGIWAQLTSLPELRIDRDSFEQDGYDVTFRAWLKDTMGREREIWAQVGTVDTPDQTRDLEAKLLQAIADFGGGGTPRDPPRDSQSTGKDEGPGDGKRGEIVINRVGRRALAVYAASKGEARRVGRLSS